MSIIKMRNPLEPGETFGRLTFMEQVEDHVEPSGHRRAKGLFECSCGNTAVVVIGHVRSGHTTSCGCHKREVARARLTTHGLSGTPVNTIYENMKSNSKRRGHPPPPPFEEFIVWYEEQHPKGCYYLGIPFQDGHPLWKPSIDRIDNDKHYTFDNMELTSHFWNNSRGVRTVEEHLEGLGVVNKRLRAALRQILNYCGREDDPAIARTAKEALGK